MTKVVPTETTPKNKTPTSRPKWERRLPPHLAVSLLEETKDRRRSLFLNIELQTTDTGEVKALLDSGATGMFIDREYVKENKFTTLKLFKPIMVRNVDGTINQNGFVSDMVELVLRYKNHSEKAHFAVSSLGSQKVIMGHPWLHKHNPDVDWVTGDASMSRCSGSCCSGCREEIRAERRTRKLEARRISTCSEGEVPTLLPDDQDEDELDSELEEGDRLRI